MRSPKARIAPFVIVVALAMSCIMMGCAAGSVAQKVEARGTITASDGTVLAQSTAAQDGKAQREYLQGEATAVVVGSVYAKGAPEGIEQRFAEELLANQEIQLTIDMKAQRAANDALEGRTGAAVVLDPKSGSILAMASTPSYDPVAATVGDDCKNRAAALYIPGSTFKTVTLATGFEDGGVSPTELIDVPSSLSFNDGAMTNYGTGYESDGQLTVLQSYAQSANTAFGQLVFRIGIGRIIDQARAFGFDSELMSDFPLETSTFEGIDGMTPREQAWSGVGQAVYREDGSIYGPFMTPVQGATIAAAVVNGGEVPRPHIVDEDGVSGVSSASSRGQSGVGQEESLHPMSQETARQIAEGMRMVVNEGTGRSAAVSGIDVGGKTGTAETAKGTSDGWFIGFAQSDGKTYAYAVLIEGDEGKDAAEASSRLIRGLFE